MIHQDYLMRMIQQLGEFFRRTLGGQSAGSTEELEVHLEQLTDELLGLPTDLILSLPPSDLIELFELSDRMVVEKCYLTAEVHRLCSEVEDDPQTRARFQERAIFFFDSVHQDLTGELAESATEHLDELKKKLAS